MMIMHIEFGCESLSIAMICMCSMVLNLIHSVVCEHDLKHKEINKHTLFSFFGNRNKHIRRL